MNRSLQVMLTILCIGACVVPVFAQRGKGIKNLTKALGKKPPLTGMAPVVRLPVTPRVPPTTAVVGVPHVALPTLERQVVKTLAKAPLTATLPVAFQNLDFLTGPQALQTFRPGWKSELLLAGFTRQQLDLVEQTFRETDQALFELDSNGNWLKPRSMEWNYTDRFAQILTDNAYGELALNDGQIKTLFGKFSRLDDVFTRLNEQSFIAVHQRAPKAGAPGEEGKLARHIKYNTDKRDGNKMNPEVEEYVYGNMPANLHTPKPSYGPKGRAPRRTPEQVLEEIMQFISENGRFPSEHSKDPAERSLRVAFKNTINNNQIKNQNDQTIVKLLELKEQWVAKYAPARSAQGVLEEIEKFIAENERYPLWNSQDPSEKSLYTAVISAISKAKNPNDPIIIKLVQLKNQWLTPHPYHYVGKQTSQQVLEKREKQTPQQVLEKREKQTPQQVLEKIEQFIKENNRFPLYDHDLAEHALRNNFSNAIKNAEDLNDPIIIRLLELKEQWVQKQTAARTPQEVLEELEIFIQKYDAFPLWTAKDPQERSLRSALDKAIRRHPDDPASVRLKELKEQFGKEKAEK